MGVTRQNILSILSIEISNDCHARHFSNTLVYNIFENLLHYNKVRDISKGGKKTTHDKDIGCRQSDCTQITLERFSTTKDNTYAAIV